MSRTARELKMDAMAKRLNEAMHGETLEDVAYACASVMCGALLQLPKTRRNELLLDIATFVDETVENGAPSGNGGEN